MLASNPYQFSIVLPLYKPAGNWITQIINNINSLNAQLPADVAVKYIVVHDGPVCKNIAVGFSLISELIGNIEFISYDQNRGKGYALRAGVKVADTPYVLITDFDFPYQHQNLITLMGFLKRGNDLVIGKRSVSYFKKLPVKRKIISKLYYLLNRTFFNLPLYDTQSGIKGFNATGKEVFLETTIDRFLIDSEFILRCHKKRLLIKVIDIELRPNVIFSNFGFSVIKTELKNFLKLLRLNSSLNKQYAHVGFTQALSNTLICATRPNYHVYDTEQV